MTLEEMKNKELPHLIEFDSSNVHYVPFADKNLLLSKKDYLYEAGYRKYGNNYYVAMFCPMKGISQEMLEWWFWWHPQNKERYEAWFPYAHKDISFDKKDKDYFSSKTLPPFKNNTQYPKETIGGKTMTLRIDFMSPSEFGFDEEIMKENSFVGAICGNVGIKGLVMHTKMMHLMKKTEEGILLVSRFYMGEMLHNEFIKKMVLNEKLAKGMAEHCYVEYRNLAEILPILYEEYGH